VEEGADVGGGDLGDFVLVERDGTVVGPVGDLRGGQEHEVTGRPLGVIDVQ